jgi:hypothetical protein
MELVNRWTDQGLRRGGATLRLFSCPTLLRPPTTAFLQAVIIFQMLLDNNHVHRLPSPLSCGRQRQCLVSVGRVGARWSIALRRTTAAPPPPPILVRVTFHYLFSINMRYFDGRTKFCGNSRGGTRVMTLGRRPRCSPAPTEATSFPPPPRF